MSILLAMLIDGLFGEPPARVHPVVWIGGYLRRTGRGADLAPPTAACLRGAFWWLLGAAVVVSLAWFAQVGLARLPLWLSVLGTALLLKPLFSFRMLVREVRTVESALQADLDQGREKLARIVSRDTTRLGPNEVRESALESLSENLSDSVVAPLFWFVLLGLPGAALYRYANTADAMWGYRGRWEWAGKFAARADDVLNFVPARLTALLLWGAGGARAPLGALRREARRTPSPNSGWPMGALALALGVRLGKPGVYTLNPTGVPPGPVQVTRGVRLAAAAGLSAGLLGAAAAWGVGGFWS